MIMGTVGNLICGSLVETPPCVDKRHGMRLITNSISYHDCLPCLCKDVLALPSVTRRMHWISCNVLDILGRMPL